MPASILTSPTAVLSLLAAVESRGGVARATTLVAGGSSRYRIARAIDDGRLVRVRRDWVALPGADAELVSAARWGVVLSCVTAARRLGLWVPAEDRCHVAADPGAAGGKPDRASVHWSKPIVPRPPDALIDGIQNTLALVATCQPFESALAIWDSALRLRLVDATALRRLDLPTAARQVLEKATPFADSGLETLFRFRLRWLREPIRAQVVILDRPVDFLIGARLVVQLDGGHHVGAQRAADIAHDAQLALRGYHVLRFTYAQVMDDWPAVQEVIMHAVAAGLHLAR